MCAIDDAEIFVRWERVERKAIKEQACNECGRTITKGETYTAERGLIAGDGWMSGKRCAHCNVGALWLVKECGGYPLNEVSQEIADHAGDYKSASLWRLHAGRKRKWQRFDGAGLMPVPTMPPVSAPERLAV